MEKYLNDAKVSFKNSLLAVFTLRVAPRGRRRVKQAKKMLKVMRLETNFFPQGMLHFRHLFTQFDFISILP